MQLVMTGEYYYMYDANAEEYKSFKKYKVYHVANTW